MVRGIVSDQVPIALLPGSQVPRPTSVSCDAEGNGAGDVACYGAQTITILGSGFGSEATVGFEGASTTTPSCPGHARAQ